MEEQTEFQKSFELATKANNEFAELFQGLINSDDPAAVGIFVCILRAELESLWKALADTLPAEVMKSVEKISREFADQITGFMIKAKELE